MVGDVVAKVLGPLGEVESLMGPGLDPHLYKPTRSDILKLTKADAVFHNGLNLEGKMVDAFERLAARGGSVTAVAEAIDPSQRIADPESDGDAADPHLWMDPTLWAEAPAIVAEVLTSLLPEEAAGFAERAEAFAAEITALHAYGQEVLQSVPAERRVLVTAHDAFSYFARAYDFEVAAIQGISTESQASLRHIDELVTLLVEREIPAVFAESSVPTRNLQAIIAGAAARGQEVVLGPTLFSDAMGEPGTYEGTYLGMIDHNLTAIARTLGGEAPERGFAGQLSGVI